MNSIQPCQALTPDCVQDKDNCTDTHGNGQKLRKEIGSVIIDRRFAVLAGVPEDPRTDYNQAGAYADISFFHLDRLRMLSTEAAGRLLPTI